MNQLEQLALELHILEGLLAVLITTGLGDGERARELRNRIEVTRQQIELLQLLPPVPIEDKKPGAFWGL